MSGSSGSFTRSSSSSSTSSDSLASSEVPEHPAEEEVLDLEEGASSGDDGCDRFANMSAAKPDLSYRGHTVHFWTIPYSAIEGRLTAENTSKKGMLRRFREVYGEALEFYAVFRELHAESSRSWERKAHYHVVLKLKGRVRWIQIARELRARGIFGLVLADQVCRYLAH
ncbi:unnamed protein product, partial [Effrenium voratum]